MAGEAVELRVTGAEQMRALNRDLKAAGSDARGLRRELLLAFRVAGKPLVDAAKESARANLPKRGGLNVWVADGAKIAVRNRLGGGITRVGVRIVATRKGNADLEDMDKGEIRHPVFGDRKRWKAQRVPEGWFTKPMEQHTPEMQAAVLFAMTIVSRRIEKGVF